MRVLKAVVGASGPVSLSDISTLVDMSPAKVHRYLVSLIAAGLIDQRKGGRYDLGPAAAEIGVAAIARVDVINRAADALPELVDRTGCTAMLSVFGTMGPTVVRWERSSPPFVTALGVGSVLSLFRSATGIVFVAWLPDRLILPFAKSERPDLSAKDIEEIRRQVRAEGIAEANEIYIPGLFALAGPVLDMQGQAEAVVTLVSTERDIVRPEAPQRNQLKSFLGLPLD
jgi:DNA-binding IclR family transcriptional regulator